MKKVLLDTSFLLPTVGIDAKREVLRGLEGLAHMEVRACFSRFSILELLYAVKKFKKSGAFDRARFEDGLRSVLDGGTYERTEEPSEAFLRADELRDLGHLDMLDNILYASSVTNGLKLLTVDQELRSFLRGHGLEDTTLFPAEMGTVLGRA